MLCPSYHFAAEPIAFLGWGRTHRVKLRFPSQIFRRLTASFTAKPSQGIATIDSYGVPKERTGCTTCRLGVVAD